MRLWKVMLQTAPGFFRERLPVLVFGFALLAGTIGSAQAQEAYRAAVDPGLVIVTNWEGWGSSLCWWANVVGGYANRETYAQLAFTTLKLNIVRYNIGGGENPGISNTMEFRAQMPGFEPTNGVWNWTADANQRWMLRRAVALGAGKVVAFANSPPWWMTVSGSVTGSTNGTSNNLQTGYETKFANYLVTVVSNLTVLDNVRFDYITPMNEPIAGWWKYGGRQEGCHMNADQQARLLNYLAVESAAQHVSAGTDGSEDSSESQTVSSVGAYGSATNNLSLLASHTYSADNPLGLRNLAVSLRKPAWISEYGDGDATGMTMARRIRNDITATWVRAWVYWQVVDNAGGWGFIKNGLSSGGSTSYSINPKFYAMAQFTQYIRPGYQIMSVYDTNSLAAYSPADRRLVLVAVNDSSNSIPMAYDLSAFSGLPPQASAVRTSSAENAAVLSPIPITGNILSATLIPQSVTTFYMNGVTPAPPSTVPVAWYRSEGDATDASGNSNDGVNAGATFVAGKLGALAAQFNGSNSYVQVPLVVSNHFTISFWLRTTDSGGTGQWWAGKGLVDAEVSGTKDDFGVCLVGNKVGLGIGNPDTTVTASTAVNDGQWHHVAATRDAVTGQMLVYIDGALRGSGFGPVGTKAAAAVLRIGSSQGGYSGDFLRGTIDDVQIFSRVFAPAEIPGLMNHAPALSGMNAGYSLLAGQTLAVTNTVSDPDTPAQTLAWTALSMPPGAMLNATNGLFSWRPAMAQAPSTNTVSLRVCDNGTPLMCATQSFTVAVGRPRLPLAGSPTATNGTFGFSINGDPGPDYVVQISTNLTAGAVWVPVFTNTPAVLPFWWNDPAGISRPQNFYRVTLGP